MCQKLSNLDARIPAWDDTDLQVRSCPLCFEKNYQPRFVRPDNLTICHCPVCKTWFISPAPSETQLQLFYKQYDQTHRRSAPVDFRILATERDLLSSSEEICLAEVSSLTDIVGKRILDVGFGRGKLLYRCKILGAIPYGVEMDMDMVSMARQHLGVNALCGSIFDLDLNERFDVIFMNDFIEHLLEPKKVLQRARELLQPGGLLVIWTPNASRALDDSNPILFRVDLEHMTYLTCHSLFVIADTFGLDIIHLETLGFAGLKGITTFKTGRFSFKQLIKLIPGFSKLNKLRHSFIDRKDSVRLGNYHLFAIFQNPVKR